MISNFRKLVTTRFLEMNTISEALLFRFRIVPARE